MILNVCCSTLYGKVNRIFLLDTGSAVSLLKESVLQHSLAVTKPSIELHGVNGDILELQGHITDVF